jgi:hypothetical protein
MLAIARPPLSAHREWCSPPSAVSYTTQRRFTIIFGSLTIAESLPGCLPETPVRANSRIAENAIPPAA